MNKFFIIGAATVAILLPQTSVAQTPTSIRSGTTVCTNYVGGMGLVSNDDFIQRMLSIAPDWRSVKPGALMFSNRVTGETIMMSYSNGVARCDLEISTASRANTISIMRSALASLHATEDDATNPNFRQFSWRINSEANASVSIGGSSDTAVTARFSFTDASGDYE